MRISGLVSSGCELVIAVLLSLGLSACAGRPLLDEKEKANVAPVESVSGTSKGREKAGVFEARGRLVCLAEEMRDLHQVPVPPVHDHLLGFRVEGKLAPGQPRYYTLLRTAVSEGFFVDKRFRKHTMVLRGRCLPATALLEVNRYRWIRDGNVYDLYYWCETCSIRGVDPGRCACCQAPVEFRESLVREGE